MIVIIVTIGIIIIIIIIIVTIIIMIYYFLTLFPLCVQPRCSEWVSKCADEAECAQYFLRSFMHLNADLAEDFILKQKHGYEGIDKMFDLIEIGTERRKEKKEEEEKKTGGGREEEKRRRKERKGETRGREMKSGQVGREREETTRLDCAHS